MDFLFGWLEDWIKQGLIDGIMGQFSGIYDSINKQVMDIATNVGQTPEAWNSGVYTMIRTLSDTAILPIAGMILTFVLCYELIQLIIEKNNMHEFDVYNIYKWIFKTFVAVYILTHTFDIVMGVFSLAQNVVNSSAGFISGSLEIDGAAALTQLQTMLETMSVWGLLGLWLEANILSVCMTALTICIFIIIYGRMIEIYLTVSVAPIPLATMANREWGQIGNNYLKSLFALAFQAFLIIICVGIYAVLVQNIPAANDVHAAIWGTAGYTVLLCFTLFKTGSLAKSLFAAH
ncbi:hypothetical protein LJC42_07565 [Eubacteriales bacterium OttesenSCG-928-K08]|nr:hypothetical protein [Eubacteriales bacterium OttesenSCG-928-K08]